MHPSPCLIFVINTAIISKNSGFIRRHWYFFCIISQLISVNYFLVYVFYIQFEMKCLV